MNEEKKGIKVLFADVDRTLNTAKTPNDNGWPLDPYMCFLVGRIVEETGCKVVLSSAWRYSNEGIAEVEKHVVKIMDTTRNDGLGTTLSYRGEKSRGTEIQEWLDRHPEVTKYAILDDDRNMLESQLPNFFPTSPLEGLTDEIANKVIEHLGKK